VLLLDEFLPQYDVRVSYHTRVTASPFRVYASLYTASLDHWGVMRTLLLLRRLPDLLSHPGSWRKLRLPHSRKIRLGDFIHHGFVLLGERAGEELVLGTVGRFWSLRAEQWETDAATFRQFDIPGAAQAALNFAVAGEADGATRLTTETRVRCTDEQARRQFRRYWALVRPFSGLIRREMLAAVRAAAEQTAPRS
jgi:hypothetical protein